MCELEAHQDALETENAALLVAQARERASRAQLQKLAGRLLAISEVERQRVASDVHDTLGQMLAAVQMNLCGVADEMAPSSLRDRTLAARTLVSSAIASVERITTALRPSMLDTLGLMASLTWLGSEFERRTGQVCDVVCDVNEPDLDPGIASAMFRVGEEALLNVEAHAEASHVTVRAHVVANRLTLEVTDNGKGFDAAAVSVMSLGHLAMQERMRQWDGELSVSSRLGIGTTVRGSVPLPAPPTRSQSTRPAE